MKRTINSVEESYNKHKEHFDNLIHKDIKFNYDWLHNGSYDSWRHERLYGLVDPLIIKSESWLTIGDGRYGTDAHYLIEKGIKKVLASDISDKQLKIAKRDKYISDYKEINAESIKLSNNSFDYVFCKESFHHFPRPILALYEMIRVARRGIVLIEPHDVRALKNNKYQNDFEAVGNYKYPISLREVEKITYAINMPGFAYKGLDDVYISGGGNLLKNSSNLNILKAKFTLLIMEILYKLKIRDRSVICLVVFKTNPKKILLDKLKNDGFRIIINRPNPYIKE